MIALIPPASGIRAELSTGGNSRVVVGRDAFQTITLPRGPEEVALTSPIGSTGVFWLDVQSELLKPFEGIGVDNIWQFTLPKAANGFDFRTLGDVLITIHYTALSSDVYRHQVLEKLGNTVSADRPFSFRQEFPDQWYDLHNSQLTATPMTVRFATRREDLPPNLTDMRIEQVVVLFASTTSEDAPSVSIEHLHFKEEHALANVGGGATTVGGTASTRSGTPTIWLPMIGRTPIGEWELSLPNTTAMRSRFENEEFDDILFVISYGATTPPWPVDL